MEDYDRDNYHTKSHPPLSNVFGDDFGDGFSGGKAKGKAKGKARSVVPRIVPYINTSGAPPVSASTSSRPRYRRDTALQISSAEDSGSADELNLCGSQPETRSRTRSRALSKSLEQKQLTSREKHGTMRSPARGARAVGKQREIRVAKAVPSPSKKENEWRSSQALPLDAPVTRAPGRARRPHSPQRASRVVAHSVASTSPSKVQPHQKQSLSDLYSLAAPVGHSFTESDPPKRSLRTRKNEYSEKRNKTPSLASQKGKGTTISSTNSSSHTRGSGSSRANTRSGRKPFGSGGESSSHQWKEVPWADLVNLPCSPAPATPKSSRTGTSKSSQNSTFFPMYLTPPDLRMKKQAILDDLDTSAPGSGSERSRKRKRSSVKEASSLSDDGGAADTTITYSQIIRESDVDPTTLCPFCDDPLPANPSRKLCSQLAYFRETCKSEQRWGNSMGLTAPVNVFVGFCALHTAETKVIPQGLRYGWPQEIDFKSVATRVKKLENKLRAVIEDPDGRGAAFYGPLKEAAARYGIGAVTGSKGSWNSFESVHAGYGEKGVVVISQILFDLFPSIPGNKVQPFDADFFRSHVLVPEAALLLIREDLSNQPKWMGKAVPRGVAFKVLQKSAAYGKAMFAEEDGTDGVADQAVRQRAKVRRKEIEREEQKEAAEQKKRERNTLVRSKAEKERDRAHREVGQVDSWDYFPVEFSSSDLNGFPV